MTPDPSPTDRDLGARDRAADAERLRVLVAALREAADRWPRILAHVSHSDDARLLRDQLREAADRLDAPASDPVAEAARVCGERDLMLCVAPPSAKTVIASGVSFDGRRKVIGVGEGPSPAIACASLLRALTAPSGETTGGEGRG